VRKGTSILAAVVQAEASTASAVQPAVGTSTASLDAGETAENEIAQHDGDQDPENSGHNTDLAEQTLMED
jgi:hypothetical protein